MTKFAASILLVLAFVSGSYAKTYSNFGEFLATRGDMKCLARALNVSGLAAHVSMMSSTFFAPTDKAFKRTADMANVTVDDLFAQPLYVKAVLAYHMHMGMAMKLSSFPKGQSMLSMMDNQEVTIYKKGSKVTLYDTLQRPAKVTKADIVAGPTLINVIDSVLIPEFDAVMMPPMAHDAPPMPEMDTSPPPASPASPSTPSTPPAPDNIVDTLHAMNQTTLLGALSLANLIKPLHNPDAVVTLFAPTEAAFETAMKMAAAAGFPLDLEHPSPLIQGFILQIAKYHVINGTAYSTDVMTDGMTLTTLIGAANKLTVKIAADGAISLKGTGSTAKIVQANIRVGKSIIHIVDTLLSPLALGGRRRAMAGRIRGSKLAAL